jgi:hypothetical protein
MKNLLWIGRILLPGAQVRKNENDKSEIDLSIMVERRAPALTTRSRLLYSPRSLVRRRAIEWQNQY